MFPAILAEVAASRNVYLLLVSEVEAAGSAPPLKNARPARQKHAARASERKDPFPSFF